MMDFILRPWEISDTNNLVLYANNENIARFMTNQFPHPFTLEHAQAFINNATQHQPTKIFAITVNNQAVGGIGIHPQADIYCNNAELGYWLAQPFWGQGIATKAIKQMVDYGFKTFNINRIYARPYGNNIASQKVLQKAGFMLEATLQNTILKNEVLLDELIYAKRK